VVKELLENNANVEHRDMVSHRIKTWEALKKVIILESTVALIVNDVFLQLLEFV